MFFKNYCEFFFSFRKNKVIDKKVEKIHRIKRKAINCWNNYKKITFKLKYIIQFLNDDKSNYKVLWAVYKVLV